jgi:hypothetical protein
MPKNSATKINSRIGKYLVRYSRSNSKPLIGLTFQHLEMQRERNFRPWITGIASVQRTYGIDPKVLGSVALRDVAGASEKPACWGVYTT